MRFLKYNLFCSASGSSLYYAEIAGTSLESKPTIGIVSGSIFVETDTGKRFVFDEASSSWAELVVATAEVAST